MEGSSVRVCVDLKDEKNKTNLTVQFSIKKFGKIGRKINDCQEHEFCIWLEGKLSPLTPITIK